jgi:V-type H+-transporting ATPase subunit H
LKVLHGLLHENYKDMTSWDVYVAEVESGHLEWGPIHTEKFFRENAKMMEGPDGDFRLVRTLILLTGCQNEDIAAVACFDVGEFVRHYPNGRSIAKRLGAKNMIMRLIEHENVDLQRQALQCVSKILVQNWAAINK